MNVRIFVAALALCALATAADARPRYAVQQTISCNDRGCSDVARPVVDQPRAARRGRAAEPILHSIGTGIASISRPARYIGGSLVCAVNVNAELARRGIQGTGSRMAKSFLNWGRPSSATPGAIAVYNRGRNRNSGHVNIVSRIENGEVYVWNPGRGGWRETKIRRAPIAYRVAG